MTAASVVGGWCTHFVADSNEKLMKVDVSVPLDKLSLAVGIMGMPG